MFVDRQKELACLDEIFARKAAQFVAVYGRRRIGKTSLLNHWLEKTAHAEGIYWVAHRSSSKILLEDFSKAVAPLLGAASDALAFSSWDAALSQLAALCEKKRLVVVIDEFPYLVEAAPSFSSLLQAAWDRKLSKTKIILVACGSHYNMMRREFMQDSGPLFGRTTADILVEDIEPNQLRLFLPKYSPEQIVETFAVIGGVPKYLEMWNDSRPVIKNIEELLLSSVTIFRQEPMFLIQDEIPEIRTYMGILDAIGSGQSHPKAIAEKCGIPLSHVGKYLATLLSLGFLKRSVSIDAPDPEKSRLTYYEIKDRFLRFYFTAIRPHLPLLEQNRAGRVVEEIKAILPSYVARNGFEEICRREIAIRGDRGDLPFQPHYVGRIWNRRVEVDVAAVDDKSKSVLLGECKWTDRAVGEEILNELRRKLELLPGLSSYKAHFALFSKSGFTSPLAKKAAREGIFLFGKKNITL
jgi:AAA+ ATPase superfamily predicted ATPase